MSRRFLVVSCLYDLGAVEGTVRHRTVADYLELAPAVFRLGFETVVFTDPVSAPGLGAVAATTPAGNVRIVPRPLESWDALAHRDELDALLRAGRRSAAIGNLAKDTAAFLALSWAKAEMLREASTLVEDRQGVDAYLWVDIGIAHVAPPPPADDVRAVLDGVLDVGAGRIRASGMDLARPSAVVDRARWYRNRVVPCLAGGLLLVPTPLVAALAGWLAVEATRCIDSGWPATEEHLLGAVLAEHPEAFELTAGDHHALWTELARAVPAETLVDIAEALDGAASPVEAHAALGCRSLPSILEQQARAVELGSPRRRLDELANGVRLARIDVPVDEGWRNTNPTVVADPDGGLRGVVRQVNYVMHGLDYHFPAGERIVRTRNVSVGFSDDLGLLWSQPVDDAGNELLRGHGLVRGFEDLRLFPHEGRWLALAVVAEAHDDALPRMAVLELDDGRVGHATALLGPDPRRVEKNWVPVVGATAPDGAPLVVYGHWPLEVLAVDPSTGATRRERAVGQPVLTRFWRGGSQFVPFDGGWLSVIHETLSWGGEGRFYVHRFASFASDFTLRAATLPFTFTGSDVEFAVGLVVDDERAVVSFGVGDSTAALATVPLDELGALLVPVTAAG